MVLPPARELVEFDHQLVGDPLRVPSKPGRRGRREERMGRGRWGRGERGGVGMAEGGDGRRLTVRGAVRGAQDGLCWRSA